MQSEPAGPATIESEYGRNAVLRVSLVNFRSYRSLTLSVDQRPVVLTGANGAGKTNLLEALSFLTSGRGLRSARLSEITDQNATEFGTVRWAVSGVVNTPTGHVRVGTGLETDATPHGDRRVVRIDGEIAQRQSTLDDLLSVVWLTPDMDRLFIDGTSARRRFLDRLVVTYDPEHSARLARYERAMRERGVLLRNERTGLQLADKDWLLALERRMAENGIAIAAARRALIRRLDGLDHTTGEFPKARVSLSGETEGWLDEMSALQAEDRLLHALESSRERDREAGRALEGPHRSDMRVMHEGRNRDAVECSTGEQKALLISIVLAHSRLIALDRSMVPVLLLDEIGAHLDSRRRMSLFEEIHALGAQAWMTGTDVSLFEGLDDRAQYFHVKDAGVHPAGN